MGLREDLVISAVPGLPDVQAGDDVAALLLDALTQDGVILEDGDIFVVAHKIVSKAEGRLVRYADVTPSPRALELAVQVRKDPRKVEVILQESSRVVRAVDREGLAEGILITEHKLGFVSANAGVDESNIDQADSALLLPLDPDASARGLRDQLERASGRRIGVIVSDTFGRPWRVGQVNVAIGLAGVPAAPHLEGEPDAWGRPLRVTQPALADELAAASGLLMEKGGKCPVILFRGLDWKPVDGSALDLIRPQKEDLFQ
jgi:coenzyme F420-0:L-glutamate ligase/coenzyme F420-1:gamma-L-glutamate ligase